METLSEPIDRFEPRLLRVLAETAVRVGDSVKSVKAAARLREFWHSDDQNLL